MRLRACRSPGSRRSAWTVLATTIPREEFERLTELALDIVDRIVALLDVDGNPGAEDSGDAEPSLASPIGEPCQLIWAAGGDRDIERP